MRAASRDRRAGFTLLEVMIVVAIVGILAAIAIPNFRQFQLKAKTSEAKVNIAGIRTSQTAYFADHNRFAAAVDSPGLSATPSQKQTFVDNGGPGSTFDELGWIPDGGVFFTYAVQTDGTQTTFTTDAAADIDGDGVVQTWGYVHLSVGGVTVNGFHGCPATGVYDPAGGVGLLRSVGPCAAPFGQSVF